MIELKINIESIDYSNVIGKIFIFLETSWEEHMRRNQNRMEEVPQDAID